MNCQIGPELGCIKFNPLLFTHCKILSGACFTLGESEPEKALDMPLPPGFPPPKAAKPVQPVSLPDMAQPHDLAQPGPLSALPAVPALPAAIPALPNVNAVVAHPENVPALPAGPVSPLAVAALAIGAVTTGAAWKFWQNRSKLRHEERMKELENQSRPDDDQKQKCETAAVNCARSSKELNERLDEIVRKLAPAFEQIEALQKHVAGAEESAAKATRKAGEVEELDERLTVLERKIRLAQAPEEKKAPAKKVKR